MTVRFQSSLIVLGQKEFCWLLYDLADRTIVEPLCDYADDLVKRCQLTRLSVEQEMGYLRTFWAYLVGIRKDTRDICDCDLIDFRDEALKRTLASPAHRGSEDAAMASTNAKLARIYDWLRWLEDTGRVGPGYIGPRDCQILSGLKRSAAFGGGRAARDPSCKAYPAVFKVNSNKSKHRLPKFLPDESTLDSVHAHFFDKHRSQYVAHRNALIATLAAYTGFRRASIQSLRTFQFDGSGERGAEMPYTEHETFLVQPVRQKYNYGNSFEIPVWLHEQVMSFVDAQRKALIDAKRVPTRIHDHHLFLSERTGKPLDDRTFSALMSKALRAIGASKGSGMHSWRGKFAVDETAEAYETRLELGLDTSISTMDVVIARSLGHKSVASARPYTSRHEAVEVARRRAERQSEQTLTRLRISELEQEAQELRRQLQAFKSNTMGA